MNECDFGNGGQQGRAKKYSPLCQIMANEMRGIWQWEQQGIAASIYVTFFWNLSMGVLGEARRVDMVVRSGVYNFQIASNIHPCVRSR